MQLFFRYTIRIVSNNHTAKGPFELKQGGGYVLLATDSDSEVSVRLIEVTQPNSVNMLWLIPQYVIITAGEVMFSIPGLEFSFTQAPLSMKSFITSMWLLAVAFGNLIVIIIAEAKFFDSQVINQSCLQEVDFQRLRLNFERKENGLPICGQGNRK